MKLTIQVILYLTEVFIISKVSNSKSLYSQCILSLSLNLSTWFTCSNFNLSIILIYHGHAQPSTCINHQIIKTTKKIFVSNFLAEEEIFFSSSQNSVISSIKSYRISNKLWMDRFQVNIQQLTHE